MAPLIVMIVSWLTTRSIAITGRWHEADSWTGALRIALATMFVFTAVSHFHPRTRPDLIRIVPPGLPTPELLVTATGVLEFIGAIGLLLPQVLAAAAYGLIALLVAMFPANVYAARPNWSWRDAAPVLSSGGYRCNCFGFRPSGGWRGRCPQGDNDGKPMGEVTCRPAPVNLLIQNRPLLSVPGSDAFRPVRGATADGQRDGQSQVPREREGNPDERPHTR